MLNKDICKKCVDRYEKFESLKEFFENNWTLGFVKCAPISAYNEVEEDISERCVFFLEQTLNKKEK